MQIAAFVLTGVGDLLNGDAVSQIFGNHTTERGAPPEPFPLLYIQATAVTGVHLRTASSLPCSLGGGCSPLCPFPVNVALEHNLLVERKSHLRPSSYEGVWEVDQKKVFGIGVD